MSVFVVGASGYIGFAVAKYFRQNGYHVYGLIRKPEQSRRLALEEIIPVVGDATKPETYQNIINNASIVVDASFDPSSPTQNIIFNVAKKHSSLHGKKIYIYTSGILVHGNNEEIVTEEIVHPLPGPLEARAKFELEVINAKEVHGIVIRPGFVYGYAGGNGGDLTDKVFNIAGNHGKVIQWKERRHSWVHVNDLADAYILTVKNYTKVTGQIFDIASDAPTYEELYRKAATVAGHKDAELVDQPFPENNPWGPFFNQTVRTSYRKAKNLLGWSPSHPNILDDLESVYVAYKANKQ